MTDEDYAVGNPTWLLTTANTCARNLGDGKPRARQCTTAAAFHLRPLRPPVRPLDVGDASAPISPTQSGLKR